MADLSNNLKRPVRWAVFPVAGLGTRILPATKAIPKEMLPLVDKPILEYAIDEARAAGIDHFVFISSAGKTVMEDHFDHHHLLNQTLERRGKTEALAAVRASEVPTGQLTIVRQPEPLGLGHAVWCARHVVGDEPFAVLLPDDVFVGSKPCLKQMVDAYNEVGGNMMAVQEVAHEHTGRYGIVTPGTANGRCVEVKGMVEKPKPEEAPSNLAIIGRYILQPQIWNILGAIGQGSGGEIQLTDGMRQLLQTQPFNAFRFEGVRHDCGEKVGWLEANIACALERPDMAAQMQAILNRYANRSAAA